jgi:hypothetical protein
MTTRIKAYALLIALATAGLLAAAPAQAQTYVFCNDGSYFTPYGPGYWWYFKPNQGWCGVYGFSVTPTLRFTYSTPYYPATNYAKWEWHNTGYDLFAYGHYYAWIDSSLGSRTSNAPYLMTYNTASGYDRDISQTLVSENWLRLTNNALWKPRNVWLDDPTGECSGCRTITFDEIKIEY